MMTEQEITQAAQAYRDYREKCGYQDPVALNEIECAYYQGMLEMLKHMTGKTEERKHEEAFETSYENTRSTIDALSHKFIEREDERIRKEILYVIHQLDDNTTICGRNYDFQKWISWLEKQGKIKRSDYPYVPGWRENRPDNKPKIKHSILMLTVHGVAEGEWLGEEWCQYRWSCKIKDTEVLYWLHLSDLETLEKENVKQGEQKHIDKIEPKFEIEKGKWYVCNTSRYTDFVVGKAYYCPKNGMLKPNENEMARYVAKSCFHLWTIQDTKDGDVLLFEGNYNSIVLFQGIGINGEGRINYHCKCDLGDYSFGIQGDVAYLGTVDEDAEHYHPATKEQRDLLFQKMKEAGYEWNTEKKELKKIESKNAWSEEDEKKIMWLVRLISTAGFRELDTDKMLCSRSEFLNWLKSLKERMKGETTGISGANISQVCNNKRKTAGGYIWRYEVQN